MSLFTHGGRIVPILQPPNPTPESTSLDQIPLHLNATPSSSFSLLDQREASPTMPKLKPMDKSLEMPCLEERGLFALATEGDGNCLYYSLSDQLHGNFDHASDIRQILATHMANNKLYFMQFVVAQGGERRRPKRAAASAYATRSADVSAPSDEDKERRFEEMVSLTRKNGEWGSSEHLQAFCQVFKVDINVYTMDGVQVFRDVHAMPDEPRDVIHVAFHDFKHYSSVRAVNGCHTGLLAKCACLEPQNPSPKWNGEEVKAKSPSDTTGAQNSPSDIKFPLISNDHDNLPHTLSTSSSSTSISSTDTQPTSVHSPNSKDSALALDVFPPWDIQSIQDGLGGRYDRETIVDMLQKCRGDIDRAFSALLGDKNDSEKKSAAPSLKPRLQASRSSSPFSTGSKRSADDSDDSEDPRPATRRGRPKKRLVSNLTLGVGISFCDDQNEVVSLNLRMKAAAEKASQAAKAQTEETASDTESKESETNSKKGPRRSGRLSKSRPAHN
ncbi:hypothetical protein N7493_000060 [Penicillium malachiteum]|uniref:OTU domain-containing protein n=1 Tax=Penicillium malachiteum TaxID=1324776 RepID=A0AAD6N0D4_9EURO|nr:hypothetical protein N7493_000060 [Penicillium malachiteum]